MSRAAVLALLVMRLAASPQRGAAPAGPAAGFEQIAKDAEAARTAERVDDAIRLYRKGVALRPVWTEGWWYLATLLYDQDRYTDARDAFRRYVQLDRTSGPGYALLGLCLFRTREYRPSLAALAEAHELGIRGNDQMREVADYHFGMLLTHFGQYDAALRIYLKYAEGSEPRPALIEAAGIAALRRPLFPSEIPPADHELVMAAGAAVWDVGGHRSAPAEQKLRNLVATFPNTPNVHFLYGSFLVPGRPDDGLKELLKELEISPDHIPCLVEVAFEYLRRGEPEQGIPYAQRAAKLDPESFVAHNALGRVLVEAEKLQDGIVELEKARDLAPDSAQTRFALGAAYRRAGRAAEAAAEMAAFERLKKVIDQKSKP